MSEPSWQDLYDLGKVTLQSIRTRALVLPGDVYDAIISGTATVGTAIIAYAEQRFRSAFLDGAQGDDLTALAHDRGVDRDLGAFAIGSVSLTRPGAGVGAGTITAGTRVATNADSTGAFSIFTLDTDAVFGALDLTKTVNATCTVVGKTGNVASGTIARFIDSTFDPTIVPSNGIEFAGGAEQETDEDLRDRVRGFFLTQARGTIDALEFGARQVPGVDRVSIVVDSSGIITVYVADAEGNSNPAMVAAVAAELEHWRDAADVLNVISGVVINQAVTLSLTVATGSNVAALEDRVRQAIISNIGLLNPGDILYRDAIASAVRAVDPQAIKSVNITVPAANIAPSANQLIRTNTGIITFV